MSQEVDHAEDRTILLAVDSLAGDEATAGVARHQLEGDPAARALGQLYIEALGMLPYALEPVPPPAELKDRLLAALAGDETQDVGPVAPPVAASARRAAPSSALSGEFLLPRRRRWPLRLAASLAVVALGAAAWLFFVLQDREAALARLRAEVRELQSRTDELAAARVEGRAAASNFALVTSPTVEFCALRPTPGAPQPLARGMLYVAADHQHWYLALHGLPAPPAGRRYQLWFLADAGPVSAGLFDARPGVPVELSSETMPAGTRAVSVTLELATGSRAPTGPQVLYGEGLTRMLCNVILSERRIWAGESCERPDPSRVRALSHVR